MQSMRALTEWMHWPDQECSPPPSPVAMMAQTGAYDRFAVRENIAINKAHIFSSHK